MLSPLRSHIMAVVLQVHLLPHHAQRLSQHYALQIYTLSAISS